MTVRVFGIMPDGDPVEEVTLRADPLFAKIITWGAVLRDLRIDLGRELRPLVLGFEQLEHYLKHARNHGANVGRYGGRTRDGRLVVDGQEFTLSRNLDGRHHLHGGFLGLGRRNWRLVDATHQTATLEIVSPDSDEGYPGELVLRCRYSLTPMALMVELTATTDAPTPVNVLHHSYFNLDGQGQVAGHTLQIAADEYLEFDEAGLPTGRRLKLAGAYADFTTGRRLIEDERFDVSFVISPEVQPRPVRAATLVSSSEDLKMIVRTTEPGLHFYNGYAAAAPVPGLDGRPHLPSSGICLEATRYNDAMNMPGLGDVILRPGQTYRQKTQFAFERLNAEGAEPNTQGDYS